MAVRFDVTPTFRGFCAFLRDLIISCGTRGRKMMGQFDEAAFLGHFVKVLASRVFRVLFLEALK